MLILGLEYLNIENIKDAMFKESFSNGKRL